MPIQLSDHNCLQSAGTEAICPLGIRGWSVKRLSSEDGLEDFPPASYAHVPVEF